MELISNWKAMIWSLVASPKLTVVLPAAGVEGIDDNPMGPDEFYTMFKLNDRNTGAAYTMRKEQREQGVPPYWGIYMAAANADEAAAKAAKLGATVLAPAFDVFDAGRMAVLRDPTGAIFSVWQPKRHIGMTIASEDNAF